MGPITHSTTQKTTQPTIPLAKPMRNCAWSSPPREIAPPRVGAL
jgi:hypothetical protein